jgi:tetratricopeptide (TPR) repeat protein
MIIAAKCVVNILRQRSNTGDQHIADQFLTMLCFKLCFLSYYCCCRYSLNIAPKHVNTLYNYGVMLDMHCKRKDDAESLYRRAIDEEPSHPFALYNLAVLLEERLAQTATADVSGIHAFVSENEALAAEDDSDSKSNEKNAERIHSDPYTVMDDQHIEKVKVSAALDTKCGESSEIEVTKKSLIAEVRSFYKRAVDADPSDAATAADFGRYSNVGP